MNRLDLYKKPILLRTFITNDDEQSNEEYKTYSRTIETVEINNNKFNEDYDFYRIVKEMIFEVDEEGRPFLYIICYTFNSSYNNLEVAALMQTSVEGSKNEIDRTILHELAMSVIYNIPVFPNHKSLEAELGTYYNELYENGFELIDKNEKVKKYKLADNLIPNIRNQKDDLSEEKIPRIYSYSEINFYKNKLMEKLKEFDNAQYIINKLKDGIKKLSVQLNSPERNENKIQEILTNYPILFGTEYTEVLDKHNFGSEFEADYVLKRYNGLYDIVEIEASTLNIYTKQGNPSSQLVHAEQQIMDWLQWIEHNNSYAREKIKKLYSPKGYVVIGRSNTLTASNREKLRRRNLVFRDKIEIITYDDLLENAKLLLDFLSGNKIEND
ncbi:Shedu anti-phage system protein SduA domain-containing protein [Lysinibacillus capsici]|uniref:Shedu anti-phage system protein SduA domain-containing protein n=1 Tax=Lysinibacillus capsici TaxID=2115968 RepID=UPI001CDA258E|nr:Shedu anti-phage system protein SduA domain-containing protein [Lysinibacillus capsici]